MINIKIYKINTKYLSQYKTWGKELMGELAEQVKNLLRQENCQLETMRLFSINNEHYVVGVMVQKNKGNLVKPKDHPINLEHKKRNKLFFIEETPIDEIYTIVS